VVLRSSLGISYNVLPLQFYERFELNPLQEDNIASRSSISFTLKPLFALVGASDVI
jgi:hypothetical protein